MLEIDTNTMRIGITRGDSASIEFGAKKPDGTDWKPEYTTDQLVFSVAKKWGGTPLMAIVNTYDGTMPQTETSLANFWTINIETSHWLNDDGSDKFKFTDYVYDVQLLTTSGAETIIGKTDDLEPTFSVWGEASEE